MSERQISSVSDLLEIASEEWFTRPRGTWVFRGHSSAAYELVPSVGRDMHTSRDRAKYELSMFEMFCREARLLMVRVPSNDWEWLAFGQHHGLPTRLLDWTQSPLMALFFGWRGRMPLTVN